jgi:Arc/MetJ-type ribon-helix-helix transcriptional regulator
VSALEPLGERVTMRLPADHVDEIDTLVDKNQFAPRSDVVRTTVAELVESESVGDDT